ncbi:MAG: hypothetical protein FWC73_09905 [Defluviitaleaceae bacterium]|nr:hypothetical protein [Defluviitaleaceae bacterium]
MAFRLLLYYIELLQLWIKQKDINLYGDGKISTLPIPEFYVVYNGIKPLERDYSTFILEHECIKIDVNVKIVNIIFEELTDVDTSNTLAGYAFFYKIFSECIKAGLSRENAFVAARDKCIQQGYLHGYVEKEDSIVFYKDILDYDMQLKQEGKSEGKAEGILESAVKLLKKGADINFVADALQLSDSQIVQVKKAIA